MAKYTTDDGITVNTDAALASWEEDTFWDGSNHISRATGSQWDHETLHKSAKGRYYVVHWSQRQGTGDGAYFISDEAAAKWLLKNDKELPEDLKCFEAKLTE